MTKVVNVRMTVLLLAVLARMDLSVACLGTLRAQRLLSFVPMNVMAVGHLHQVVQRQRRRQHRHQSIAARKSVSLTKTLIPEDATGLWTTAGIRGVAEMDFMIMDKAAAAGGLPS